VVLPCTSVMDDFGNEIILPFVDEGVELSGFVVYVFFGIVCVETELGVVEVVLVFTSGGNVEATVVIVEFWLSFCDCTDNVFTGLDVVTAPVRE